MRKSIASAIEIYFSAAVAFIAFGVPFNGWSLVAVIIMSYGIWLYSAASKEAAPSLVPRCGGGGAQYDVVPSSEAAAAGEDAPPPSSPARRSRKALLGLDTPTKATIFVAYIALWCAIRGLVFQAKNHSGVAFDNNLMVLLVAILKLAIAIAMYVGMGDGDLGDLKRDVARNPWLFAKFAVPGLLYALSDTVLFAVMHYIDSLTYMIVMQGRLLTTGLIWQLAFHQPLSREKWVALAAITVAVIVKEVLGPHFESAAEQNGEESRTQSTLLGYALCLVNIVAATGAGVYCELLIKTSGKPPAKRKGSSPEKDKASDGSRQEEEDTDNERWPHPRESLGLSSDSEKELKV